MYLGGEGPCVSALGLPSYQVVSRFLGKLREAAFDSTRFPQYKGVHQFTLLG